MPTYNIQDLLHAGCKCINIGASQTKIESFVNVDISAKADLATDLSKEKLDLDSDSVDLIFSNHTLEHIENLSFCLKELYRVSKNNAIWLFDLPYCTLSEYHSVNPYHLHDFNEHFFKFYDTSKLKGSASESNPVDVRTLDVEYRYMKPFHILPSKLQDLARRHLWNTTRDFSVRLRVVKKTSPRDANKLIRATKPKDLKKLHDEIRSSRIRYSRKSQQEK